VAVLGVGLGITVLEKHITLDRRAGGPDNDVACEPEEFKRYIEAVRIASAALGRSEKRLLPTEEKWREAARKSIVAAVDIPAGAELTSEMLVIKRPSTGLHPRELNNLVGRRTRRALGAGQLVDLGDLAWDE